MPQNITAKQAFIEGMKDHLPYVVGSIPFGILAGFLAIKLGFAVWHAMVLSVVVFAGASQLVGLELMNGQATIVVVFLSALAVNARFLMYSASLAPHTKHWPLRWKIINAATMVDASYALCLNKFNTHFENNRWYMFGCNVLSWSNWILCTYIGAVFGNVIPSEMALEFALPLIFITMGAVFIKDKTTIAVALISGGLAVLLRELPYNAGLMIAIVAGVALGYFLSERLQDNNEGDA